VTARVAPPADSGNKRVALFSALHGDRSSLSPRESLHPGLCGFVQQQQSRALSTRAELHSDRAVLVAEPKHDLAAAFDLDLCAYLSTTIDELDRTRAQH
jgi:hypothetical protein